VTPRGPTGSGWARSGTALRVHELWDLFTDTQTASGRAATSAVVVAVGVVVSVAVGHVLTRRADDAYSRYYARKFSRYVTAVVVLIVLAAIWRAFAGRIGVVVGFTAAGLAFAMQEVIGALAGFVNILTGRIFRVGDRVQMGGVQGDVIDITPMRTKIMEMGGPGSTQTWVGGRQYTGRIVAISNKATFTEPVYNYSSVFEFIWEELSLPVAYDDDHQEAIRIMRRHAEEVSSAEGAQRAIAEMTRRYPIARADVEPRVFVRATDDWIELSARFVVPVRAARRVKDELTRRILADLDAAGIRVASETAVVTLHTDQPPDAPDER
jgi:small-conductance mechanosensitive channel